MGKLVCEVCNGESLVKQGDGFKCADCGAIFPVDTVKELLVDTLPQTNTPNKTDISPANSNARVKSISGIIACSVPILFVLLIAFSMYFSLDPKINAKESAKARVAEKWQQVDENLKLIDIDYDPVDVDGNIYTVSGTYHVTDGTVSDFRGGFVVTLRLESSPKPNIWHVIDCKIEIPEALLPYA